MYDKVAIISDIHGNLPALESIINDIKNRKINKIICLGDVIGLGPNSKECLDLIIKNNIDMVLGNHELYILYGSKIDKNIDEKEAKHYEWVKSNLTFEQIDFLKKCNLQIELNDILFEHFLLNKSLKYPFYSVDVMKNENFQKLINEINKKYIFIGHEHKNIEFNNKLIVVGSSGCTKNDNTSYYVIDMNNSTYNKNIVEYDRKKFEELLSVEDYPERKIISKIFFGIEV